MSKRMESSAIGVAIAMVGIILVTVLAYASTLLRIYAPGLRDYILWLVCAPQFGIGLLFGMMLIALLALSIACQRP